MDERLINKFKRHITPRAPDECWPYAGHLNAYGYGTVTFGAAPTIRAMAHRIAYFLDRGPIPDGLDVMHTCHNPTCCNPRHLEVGTRKENMRMSLRDGRMQRRIPMKDMPLIIERRKQGETLQQIAETYGCTKNSVFNMLKRHGPDPVVRTPHTLTFQGETLTLHEWAARTGLPFEMIRHRYLRAGWTAEKTLTTPRLNGGGPPGKWLQFRA